MATKTGATKMDTLARAGVASFGVKSAASFWAWFAHERKRGGAYSCSEAVEMSLGRILVLESPARGLLRSNLSVGT